MIGCTPNGSMCFVSELFLGSISDVQLTNVSGHLDKLETYPFVSIMADKGFTIKYKLASLNIELNAPPFLDNKVQFTAAEVKEGRMIGSLQIHVEKAIGRLKTYGNLDCA